jgi:integrase-like protein
MIFLLKVEKEADMHKDQLRDINPNELHGCHPSDLSSYVGETLFHLRVKKSENALPAISSRLRLLERILSDISRSDLPAKDHFAEYIRQRYRRNCRPNTLRAAATSMKQFLSFYRKTGKQHIEQMTREDIEIFTEDLQDRGLKPTTVSFTEILILSGALVSVDLFRLHGESFLKKRPKRYCYIDFFRETY